MQNSSKVRPLEIPSTEETSAGRQRFQFQTEHERGERTRENRREALRHSDVNETYILRGK